MRKIIFAVLIVVVFVFLMVVNSCSKRILPETGNTIAESQVEKEHQNDFIMPDTAQDISTQEVIADEIIKTARIYIGVPHCMGGTSMKCMDCSGLLVTVFGKHGIHLPHNSEEQAKFGTVIRDPDKLIRGDLVFFIRTYNTTRYITHSGIYLGNNEFIHTSSGRGVTITSLKNPWWSEKFIFGTRILNN